MIAREVFARRLLKATIRRARYRARVCVMAWMQAEVGLRPCTGVPGEGPKFNPLCTTKAIGDCAESDYNSVGVKNYATAGCGIVATRDTLALPAYDEVRFALRKASIMHKGWRNRFATAVGNSPWGTDGDVVRACIDYVEAHYDEVAALTIGV